MDAFERNKYREDAYFKLMLSKSVVVSYGFISAVDLDTVEVTLTVTNKNFPDKVSCTFMNLGNDQFSLSFKPAVNMRVVVFSPHKGTNGMYESVTQIKKKEGKGYIRTGSPAVYSSQQSFCFPMMKSTSQALSSLMIDSNGMSLEIAHSLVASITGVVDLFISKDTAIEFNEGTKHTRSYEGDLTETFGMVEGIGGAEKSGTYLYEETYGKFSTVKKNYESGVEINIGKAYPKPFLENKGTLADSSAPVTINMGANAPITLNFGDSAVTVEMGAASGLTITLTGSAPVSIVADAGLLEFKNSIGSLADVINAMLDALVVLGTAGGPVKQAIDPATVAALEQARVLLTQIFV